MVDQQARQRVGTNRAVQRWDESTRWYTKIEKTAEHTHAETDETSMAGRAEKRKKEQSVNCTVLCREDRQGQQRHMVGAAIMTANSAACSIIKGARFSTLL